MHKILFAILGCFVLAACAHADTIAVWNFNDAIPGITGGAKEFIVSRGFGTMTSDFIPANIGNYGGSVINSQNGDPAGKALGLVGSANNGRSLTWFAGTAGFDSIWIGFALQRSGTGFAEDQFLYSVDFGASWTSFAPYFSPGTAFALQAFDLSSIETLNNNPGAGFRIVFGGATSPTGNNRIDNLVVAGSPAAVPPGTTPVPEPSTLVLATAGIAFSLSILSKRKPRNDRTRISSRFQSGPTRRF